MSTSKDILRLPMKKNVTTTVGDAVDLTGGDPPSGPSDGDDGDKKWTRAEALEMGLEGVGMQCRWR